MFVEVSFNEGSNGKDQVAISDVHRNKRKATTSLKGPSTAKGQKVHSEGPFAPKSIFVLFNLTMG